MDTCKATSLRDKVGTHTIDEKSNTMAKGSCLCGAVTFSVNAVGSDMTHCHCSMCRKSHGALFATFYDGTELVYTQGQDAISVYESSHGFLRSFCSKCGSPMPDKSLESSGVYVPAGLMDDDPGVRPGAHIFVESKADFYKISDNLPQRQHYGDGELSRVVDVPKPVEKSGCITGNCQCGAVAFECVGEPTMMMNCHCSRCRKVKGAAHATNVFFPGGQLSWVRGEDNVANYSHAGAKVFGNAFCKTCGSSMPRARADGSMYNVPAGSLNQAPGIEAKGHIFIGSKADWFDVTEDKPQWDEMPV